MSLAKHIDDVPRWECPGCTERDALLVSMLSKAREIIAKRDEIAAEGCFETCPDYACGRPDGHAIALAEMVLNFHTAEGK